MSQPILRAAVFALAALSPLTAHAQTARVTLQSQPGNYIGQGQTYDYTYTPANTVGGLFAANIRYHANVDGQPAFLDFLFITAPSPPNRFVTLSFATNQLGVPISVGTFLNAQRASFATAGHPGLDVTFMNRGSNTVTGNFTVTDVGFYNDGSTLMIDHFSAQFEQLSEGFGVPLFGTITYRSANAITVPETSSLLFLVLAAMPLAGVIRRRRNA